MKLFAFSFLLLAVVLRELYAGKCAKACNKESTPCKGEKTFIADEKLARGAGINVGDHLCISHRIEARRANSRCSFPSESNTHSKVLVELPKRLYQQVDRIGTTSSSYKPGCKWCTKCKRKERELVLEEGYTAPKARKVCTCSYYSFSNWKPKILYNICLKKSLFFRGKFAILVQTKKNLKK